MSSDTQIPLDNIHLRNIQLPLAVTVGRDAWHRDDKPQPATISLRIGYPSSLIASASETDTVAQTLDYGKLYRAIEANIAQSPGMNLFGLSSAIRVPAMLLVQETLESAGFSDPTNDYFLWRETEIFIHLPKAILRAEQGIRYRTFHLGAVREEHDFTIEGIRCYCIVGINPHERREKQAVVVTLSFSFSNFKNTFRFLDVYQELAQDVAEVRGSPERSICLFSILSRLATVSSLWIPSWSADVWLVECRFVVLPNGRSVGHLCC